MASERAARKRPPAAAVAHIAKALRPLAVPIQTVKGHPANPRTHDARNTANTKASLERFGQTQPLLVQPYGKTLRVVAGHNRLCIAKELGWKWIAVVPEDLSDEEAMAMLVADNASTVGSAWDPVKLADLREALRNEDSDLLEVTGITDAEVARMLDELGNLDEMVNDVAGSPEPAPEPAKPAAQEPPGKDQTTGRCHMGDTWQLGDYLLLVLDEPTERTWKRLKEADVAILAPPDVAERFIAAWESKHDTHALLRQRGRKRR